MQCPGQGNTGREQQRTIDLMSQICIVIHSLIERKTEEILIVVIHVRVSVCKSKDAQSVTLSLL